MWLIVLFFSVCSSTNLSIYNNARFEPNDVHFVVNNISFVNSQMECACRCFNSTMCLTATYFGIEKRCILSFARLDQGKLFVMVTSAITSVLTFKNKTLPAPIKLTGYNEIVYGIWNTAAGGDSHSSSPGYSQSNYPLDNIPENVFDDDEYTRYAAYGACDNSSYYYSTMNCGENTGLYLSLRRGSSLLVAFRICTATTYSGCDPITVTIEGSNESNATLMLGSSWTLIYNGPSGLRHDPGGGKFGTMQWLSSNSIWYASYRVLVTSKRAGGNYVHYSELELLGY